MRTTVEEDNIYLQYVRAIQSLGEEFTRATDAISRNDVSDLEHRVARQQTLCAQLALLQSNCDLNRISPRQLEELAQAMHGMNQRRLVFGGVVAMNSRSQQTLLGLCHAYRDQETQSGRGPARTLSCEG